MDTPKVHPMRLHADRFYGPLYPLILELRKAGKSLEGIAESLNERGHKKRNGTAFDDRTVSRLLAKIGDPLLSVSP